MKQLLFTSFIILVFCGLVFPQGKGILTGKVTDSKTSEPVPGANIIIKGTYHGGVSDIKGAFKLVNVTPGTYTIAVSFIGYREVQYTGIKIEEGKTKTLEIKLEETMLTLGQDIVIIGTKPLVDVEETQTKRTLGREDIDLASVENIKDLVSQQAGVVQSDNSLHIRGGRSNENAFLLDGVSVQDPLAGTGFGLQLSSNSIEEVEVITGGFNAEFGQATSGVVNVRTREGSQRYSGGFSYKRDNLGDRTSNHVFNTDILETNLSGPEPITTYLLPAIGIEIPGEFFFFGSVYLGTTDGIYQGYFKPTAGKLNSSTFFGTRFSPRAENNGFWLGKISYKYSPTLRFVYSFNQSVNINQNSTSLQANLEYVEPSPGYQFDYQNTLGNANVFTHNNKYHTLSLNHTVSKKMFYELKFNYFFTHMRVDANGRNYNQYTEPKDFVGFPIQYYKETSDSIGVLAGDGFWDVGNPSTWRDHYLQEFSARGDLTNFFDEKNKFKAGFNVQFQKLQVVDIFKPYLDILGQNNDIYTAKPVQGSFYAQDNVTFSGMILNFGMRFDYWFPGKIVDDAIEKATPESRIGQLRDRYYSQSFRFFGDRYFKGRLSPRLGISHPVSNNQMLFFSYGHFSKWPNPQYVYAKLVEYQSQSDSKKFGNPALNPETTVAYELGLKTQFTENDVLTLTTYYKDIFDYVSTRTALSTSTSSLTKNTTYVNSDYARSRGIEFEYRKRIGRWFNGNASFTYSIVTGKATSADDGNLVARGELNETIKESYMSWDRPFTINLFTNFYVAKDEPLFDFAAGILDDYNITIKSFFQSGKRYTPYIFAGTDQSTGQPKYEMVQNERYSKIGDNWFWVDLNIEKYIMFDKTRMSLFVEISNLLDNKNSAIINPVTGHAYENGDPTPYNSSSWNNPQYPIYTQHGGNPYPFNPARYLARRNIRFGLSLKF